MDVAAQQSICEGAHSATTARFPHHHLRCSSSRGHGRRAHRSGAAEPQHQIHTSRMGKGSAAGPQQMGAPRRTRTPRCAARSSCVRTHTHTERVLHFGEIRQVEVGRPRVSRTRSGKALAGRAPTAVRCRIAVETWRAATSSGRKVSSVSRRWSLTSATWPPRRYDPETGEMMTPPKYRPASTSCRRSRRCRASTHSSSRGSLGWVAALS